MVCSIAKRRNAADAALGLNPPGRGRFGAGLRCDSLIWNDQTRIVAPCPAPKSPRRATRKSDRLLEGRHHSQDVVRPAHRSHAGRGALPDLRPDLYSSSPNSGFQPFSRARSVARL